MARDYRYGHRTQSGFQRQSQKRSGQPKTRMIGRGRIWGASLALSISLIGGYLVIQHFMDVQAQKEVQPPSEIYTEVNAVAEPDTQEEKGITVEAVSPPPDPSGSQEQSYDYSFYRGLKETEVVVDAVPISVALEDAYYIHAGTFGKQKYALREQARLKELGQVVELSAIDSGGRTYYRLRTGPFHDRLEMNRVRNELRALGVDTLLVKAAKPDA